MPIALWLLLASLLWLTRHVQVTRLNWVMALFATLSVVMSSLALYNGLELLGVGLLVTFGVLGLKSVRVEPMGR